MKSEEVLEILQKVGAFRSGHFVLTNGRHSDSYINKDALFTYPSDTSSLCNYIAHHFKGKGIDVVIGPAVAAAILAQWTAFHLSAMENKNIYATYADKAGEGGFIIKRGYDLLIKGKKILVVEDLTTTGGSILKVVNAVRAAGGEIAGVAVLCNRGNVTVAQIGNPPELFSLSNVELESWEEGECELCSVGIPVNTDIGHGKHFLEQHKK